MLNKVNDIEYSIDKCEIVSIHRLSYDKEKKSYNYNMPKKTVKPSTKSKSKVDRHFSRSKSNKDKDI
jgi:hypothetical protein